MERVQATQRSPEDPEHAVPSLAPHSPAAPSGGELEALAVTARSMPGQDGRDALERLTLALTGLTPTEENGKRLLQLLDEGAFNELRSNDGSQTRELAVETLLRLGYPWAVQVHPDELAWYRRLAFVRRRNNWLILLGVFGVGVIAEAFLLGLF